MTSAKPSFFHYLIAFLLILGVKFWYSQAAYNDLEWILSPTAWWVGFLSGIPFEKAEHIGYINHSLRFIIAPSCSGVRFMLIAYAVLVFPFLHRNKTVWTRWGWMIFSMGTAYLYTIMINGWRIILSIYLPSLLVQNWGMSLSHGWFTPEKLHTLIGTTVYFSALLLLYRGTEIMFRKAGSSLYMESEIVPAHSSAPAFLRILLHYMPPVLCYFIIVLGIPFLCRIFRNRWDNFMEYTLTTTAVCLIILLCFSLTGTLRQKHLKP